MAKVFTKIDLAANLCKRFPKAASRALARKLYDEHNLSFRDVEDARETIRRARGASGKKNRTKARVPREHKKPGWHPECPPSAAESWKPVELPKPCRVLSLSDIHIPYHDQKAVQAAVEWGVKFNPTELLINGDCLDFHGISRWDKDPNARTLKQELQTGRELLSWLRGKFPKANFRYKIGNHDDRWDKYIWQKAPELFDIEHVQLNNVLEFEKFNIQRIDDQIVLAGELPILHGHELPKGLTNPVNPARGAFLRTNSTILIGHLHRSSTHADPNLWHDETAAWSQGCLCDRRPKYARINKWNWGFAAVEVDKEGQFDLHNLRISNQYKVRPA